MSLTVFLAVLLAALMHASWNAFVKLRIEPLLAMTLISIGAGLIAIPALVFTGVPPLSSAPWIAGSLAFHLGYYIALAEAYRRADVGQIYPIARGSAPLLTGVFSLLVLGEPLRPAQIAAVFALGFGVILISLLGRRPGSHFDGKSIGYALLTAFTICGYTLFDGYGAREAGNASAYAVTLFVLDAIPLPIFVLLTRGSGAFRIMKPHFLPGCGGGALALGSYWIAIWAMSVAPIALVAALRESSVLFATAIAIIVLKEPLHWPRLVAGAVIFGSLVLMRMT